MATLIKAAYWNSESDSPVPDSKIPPSVFTHIYYAFVQPDPTTFELNVTQDDEGKISNFTNFLLQPPHPPVKTLLSIGGANNDNLDVFAKMASNEQNRQAFISSSIQVARKYNFDGVDLDWEFPRSVAEMTDLGLLYKEWSEALDQDAREQKDNGSGKKPRLLLTSAVYYALKVDCDEPMRSYPAREMANCLDWINLKCYDYNIQDAPSTYPPAALRNPQNTRNTADGIQSWINASVPARKLVMGMPLYGRMWTLQKQNPANNGIGAKVEHVTIAKKMAYRDILAWNAKHSAEVDYDDQMVSCYSYWGMKWIGYDDARCVAAKVKFAKEQNLAGYFFRAMGQDTWDWTLSHKASRTWN